MDAIRKAGGSKEAGKTQQLSVSILTKIYLSVDHNNTYNIPLDFGNSIFNPVANIATY